MGWNQRNKVRNFERSMLPLLISQAETVIVLVSTYAESNTTAPGPFKFSQLVGIGIEREIVGRTVEDLATLRDWLSNADDLVMGYFSYEMKDLLENLRSNDQDRIGFPLFHFFIPESVIIANGKHIECHSHADSFNFPYSTGPVFKNVGVEPRPVDRNEYISTIKNLKDHIQQGDIYEVNYCVEHLFENVTVDPFRLFGELQNASPAPFSCYVADKGKHLMSSSPERFIMKTGSKLISQPIKGTNRRTADNTAQLRALRNDPKEVSENVMITDLVRNDLSKSAAKGSVNVDELCGVYEFAKVNQMISTVSAELRDDVHPLDALLNAFPMGSMTGAPKVSAMELIERYENFSRGLYSGAVGYFTPELDFDFNVVIRSVLYNKEKKVVSFPTGGAITINSDPEKEYAECLLKSEAMRNVLMNHGK